MKAGDTLGEQRFWWSGTVKHMWRVFFLLRQNSGSVRDTPSSRKIYDACNAVYTRLPERDQAIIEAYYTCRYEDIPYAAEDYSARTGISIYTIYSAIKRAGYSIMAELGLIDKERR